MNKLINWINQALSHLAIRIVVCLLISGVTAFYFSNYISAWWGMLAESAILFVFSFLASKKEVKKSTVNLVLSLFESLFLLLGKQMAANCSTSLEHLLVLPIVFSYFCLINNAILTYKPTNNKFKELKLFNNYWFRVLVLFAGWCIWLFIFNPGMVHVDTCLAIKQNLHDVKSLHYSPPYTALAMTLITLCDMAHMPVLATMMQMIMIAMIFSLALSKLNNRTSLSLATALSIPVGLWAICVSKDSLFLAVLMLFLVNIYCCLKGEKTNYIFLTLQGVILALLRNNFAYVLILFALALIFAKADKKIVVSTLIIVVCFFGYNGVMKSLGYKSDGIQESMSVPLQQIVRSYKLYPDEFTAEEEVLLANTLNPHAVEFYIPQLSDPVKAQFNQTYFKEHISEWAKMYINHFVKHPLCYIDSFVANTYYLYYPESYYNIYSNDTYVSYCTQEDETKEEITVDKNWFDTNGSYFEANPPIPALYTFVKDCCWNRSVEDIPVIAMLFSFGNMLWLYLTALAVSIKRKEKPEMLTFILVGIYTFSLLFGPCILLRYVIYLFALAPVEIMYIFGGKKDEENMCMGSLL